MESYTISPAEEYEAVRIDKFIGNEFPDLSRSYIQKLIEKGLITVNGKSVVKNFKICASDVINIKLPDPEPLEVIAEDIPLDIVYEDDSLLVVNKPQNMVVHPAAGNTSGTLVNALLYHCKGSLSGINGVLRPGIVHRIDKNTSGLLIVAKTDSAHKFLAQQIKDHSFTREYEAIVYGNLKEKSGTITTQIGRHKIDRKKMSVLSIGGKTAITHYKVLKEYKSYSHIKLNLETGRTHQIRVHMSYIGHPVLGDDVYGARRKHDFKFISGQCLHAKKIGFIHPDTKQYLEFESELPDYFKRVLEILESDF